MSLNSIHKADFPPLRLGRCPPQPAAGTMAQPRGCPTNPPEWVEKLRPELVLFGVAAGYREGRPSHEILDAVKDYTLLHTDRNG